MVETCMRFVKKCVYITSFRYICTVLLLTKNSAFRLLWFLLLYKLKNNMWIFFKCFLLVLVQEVDIIFSGKKVWCEIYHLEWNMLRAVRLRVCCQWLLHYLLIYMSKDAAVVMIVVKCCGVAPPPPPPLSHQQKTGNISEHTQQNEGVQPERRQGG
jgi:hypothetical protein